MARLTTLVVRFVLLFSLLAVITPEQQAGANPASAPTVTVSQVLSPSFDINSAVEFYLAKMPSAERARSNSYFEGGYWLQLWDFLSTVLVMWLLLKFGWSRRMRDLAE